MRKREPAGARWTKGTNRMTFAEKVAAALDEVRPALEAHGGNVSLIEVHEDGIVDVELEGACKGCPMSQLTLTMGIERHLKEQVPEVVKVRNIGGPQVDIEE
jgi:Fe-S cluster biogenesis protein NfuA